jgi:hypothetical protein
MEEQLLKIGKFIKGFRDHIQHLQLKSMLGIPIEVRKGGVWMAVTTVANINKIEDKCAKLCEESAQVWE